MSSSKAGHRVLIVKIIVFILLFSLIHNGLSELLSPIVYIPRTTIRGMYAQKQNIDVVFFGSSKIYSSCNPKIYDDILGVNTYNMATAAQTWEQSYYLLIELLKTNTPKTVIVNTAISRFNNAGRKVAEAIGLLINDELRFSKNALEYFSNVIPKSKYLEALSPAYRYRDNLGVKMLNNLNRKNKIAGYWDANFAWIYKGYSHNDNILSRARQGTLDINKALEKKKNDKWTGEIDIEAIEFFEKFVKLCEYECIDMILVDIPNPTAVTLAAENYNQYSDFIRELARKNNIKLWDFNMIKPGYINYDMDRFRDFAHMNTKGATEFSTLFATMLKQYHDDRFNRDQFFYDSYDEWYESYHDIANLWLNTKETDGIISLTANCYCGKDVTPLYQFLIKEKGEKEYTKLQDYSENSVIEFKPENSIEYVVKVNALSNKNMEAEPMYYVRNIKVEK